jgi:hypothetical protein
VITCLTHIADGKGKCMDCGINLPDVVTHQGKNLLVRYHPTQGDHIGVITSSLNTGSVAYKVGEHDSNKPCTSIRQ